MSKNKHPKKDDKSSEDAYERAKAVRERRDAEDVAAEQARKSGKKKR